jgi:hypothetical protein
MALKFVKNAGKTADAAPAEASQDTAATAAAEAQSEKKPTFAQGTTKTAPQQQKPATPAPSTWMKRGVAAASLFKKEEARAEERQAMNGRMFRFWIEPGGSALITFLDGDINDEGMLDAPTYLEHRVFHNGEWRNYVCIQESEPCPICEAGDQPTLAAALTVIDHRKIVAKKSGKVHEHERKLFVMTRTTLKDLTLIAQKQKGLRHMTFEVDRGEKKNPRVGNLFTPKDKNTKALLLQHFGKDRVEPAVYASEIPYFGRAKLIEMGFAPGVVIGAPEEKASGGGAADKELADQL